MAEFIRFFTAKSCDLILISNNQLDRYKKNLNNTLIYQSIILINPRNIPLQADIDLSSQKSLATCEAFMLSKMR